MHKKPGGVWPGQLTQTGQRDIPYHRMSCPVYKLGGVGQKLSISAQEGEGHWSVDGEQLYWALFHFVPLGFIPLFLSSFSLLLYFTLFQLLNRSDLNL